MPDYSDVPNRLLHDEAVPESEIIGYNVDMEHIQTRITLSAMAMFGVLDKVYEDGTLKYRITAFGHTMRTDFITRIDGDCPECPECP